MNSILVAKTESDLEENTEAQEYRNEFLATFAHIFDCGSNSNSKKIR